MSDSPLTTLNLRTDRPLLCHQPHNPALGRDPGRDTGCTGKKGEGREERKGKGKRKEKGRMGGWQEEGRREHGDR